MYAIRPVPGKGQGVFAEKEIKAGTRILVDELLFSITQSTKTESIGENIRVALEALPPEQQQQFETLCCPDLPAWTPLVSRYVANCFEVGVRVSAIFLKASRVNHSCRPNAFFSWNENLHRLTVHAIEDIPAGEEITVSYVFPFYSLENRKKSFRDNYGFDCDCPTCQLGTTNGQRGDVCRQRMEKLYLAVDKCNGGPSNNDEKELDMVLEFITMAQGQRMDGEFLSCMYRRARQCYEDRGYKKKTLEYAEMELETNTRLLGKDHPSTEESATALMALKARLAVGQGLTFAYAAR